MRNLFGSVLSVLAWIVITVFGLVVLPFYFSTWGSAAAMCLLAGFTCTIVIFGLGFVPAATLAARPKLQQFFDAIKVVRRVFIIGALIVAVVYAAKMGADWTISPKTTANKPVETSTGTTFSLGKPADPATVDPAVAAKPEAKAVMVDANGQTVYTQSGKNGQVLLKGKILEGEALELDAFAITKTTNGKTESYTNGCLWVVVGPLDLDANPISYTDGCAQKIGVQNLQKFLDENVWVKFSRGDRLKDNSAWSYKPWALNNIWLPEGYTFKKLGTLNAKNDTFPNK